MKVLHLNTFDSVGGAARAMAGLHRALADRGVDSRAIVLEKRSMDPRSTALDVPGILRKPALRHLADTWPLIFYRNKVAMHWTRGVLGSRAARLIDGEAPDVVHLHWVGLGLLSISQIGRIRRPIVWTLHDSWPFTGGCHVPGDCTRYRTGCGACPQLGSHRENDISRDTWQKKQAAWHKLNLVAVTPSRWLASCVSASSLFRSRRVEVIPNGVDGRVFQPLQRVVSRDRLGLPRDGPLLMFGAVHADRDANKGWDLLRAALGVLQKPIALVVFGSSGRRLDIPGHRVFARGAISSDEELCLLYSAADVTVVPSRLENYPNVILESLACGTPVAAFAAGGIPEMIEQHRTGFLAKPYDPVDLAKAVQMALAASATMRAACREWIERNADLDTLARRHIALYEELLK